MQVILRQPDQVVRYGNVQVLAATTLLEVRAVDLPNGPQHGDLFVLPEQTLSVLGESRRDSARLVWVCEAIEQ